MSQDRTISALFTINSYNLSVLAGTGGSVSGSGSFQYGSSPTISATPDTGYSFAGWTGDGVTDHNQSTTSVNMTQNRMISAHFVLRQIHKFLLTVEASPISGGTITGAGEYNAGEIAQITASPNIGYSFTGWTGDGVSDSTQTSTTVDMSQDRTISASFTINSYNLSVLGGSGGSVSGNGSFNHGSYASITATPDTGYSFAGWTGDDVQNPLDKNTTILINDNRTVSASFTINSYDLSVLAGTGGSVSGNGSFDHGSYASITATPDTGYSFAGWTGDDVQNPLDKNTTILINDNRTVSASFTINSYDLSVLAGTGGSVSGNGSFDHGSYASITATPDTGYSFAGWTGDDVQNPLDKNTTILINDNRTVSASFTINSYDLSVLAGTGGSVSGNGSFDHGSYASISATPDTGYSFAGWTGDDVQNPSDKNTTILMNDNRTVSASFIINSYDLSVLGGTGGSVSGNGSFNHGSYASITAIPDTGYSFAGWTGDGVLEPISPNTSVYMSEERNVSASFLINSYTLFMSSDTGGSVSGAGIFTYGSTPSISASPSNGYTFAGWTGEGISNASASSTTVFINQDRNISAQFLPEYYSVNVDSGNGGTTEGLGNFPYGTNAKIIAIPDPGYKFYKWIGGGVENPLEATTNILVSKNRSVFPIFELNERSSQLNALPIENGWFSSWLGTILQTSDDWIFHPHLDWIFPSSSEEGIWIWQNNLGWAWTQKEIFYENFLWLANSEDWIYLDIENDQLVKFFDYQSKKWINW